MPIEFRCTACDKLLRTPDGTAGKQAKCPECGAVMQIPAPTSDLVQQTPSESAIANPFARDLAATQPGPRERENPYQSPVDYAAPAPAYSAAPGALVPTPLDVGDVLSRTWNVFREQWLMCAAAWLIVVLLSWIVGQIIVNGALAIGAVARSQVMMVVSMTLGQLAANLFMLWLTIGLWLFFLKTARGLHPPLAELFRGGPYLVNVLLAGLLVFLAVFGVAAAFVLPATAVSLAALPNAQILVRLLVGVAAGGVLAIIPCTIVGLMLSQFYWLILDRNAAILESLKLSKRVTHGNKAMIFAIRTVTGLAGGMVILLTCFTGILAVGPFLALLPAVMYLAMTGQATVERAADRGPAPVTPGNTDSPLAEPGGGQPFQSNPGGQPPNSP